MKTTIARFLACVAVPVVSSSAFALTDLTIFSGKYAGPVALTIPGTTSTGKARVIIRSPGTGATASVSYTAKINFGGGNTLLPTEITLHQNGTVDVTDLGVGIAGTNNAHPGTGTFTQSRKRLTFTATNGDITLTGRARVKDLRNKRQLKLTLISSDAGGSSVFRSTLKSRPPRGS